MKNLTFVALVLALMVVAFQPGQALAQIATTTPAKTTVAPAKKAVAKPETKSVAKPAAKPVAKPATKPAAKPATVPASKKVAPTIEVSTAIAPVSTSAVTVPNSKCMQAVSKANKYCASIASGCSSTNPSAKCQAANDKCEQKQKAALELCPAI